MERFKLACAAPELEKFVPELADECVEYLFPNKNGSPIQEGKKYSLSREEVERICVEHSKKLLSKLDLLTTPSIPWRKFQGERPQALLFLAREYVKGRLGKVGRDFWERLLARQRERACKVLVVHGVEKEEELGVVYGEEFFHKVGDPEDLKKYPQAISFLIQTYLKREDGCGAEGKRVMEELLRKFGREYYRILFERLYAKNGRNTKQFVMDVLDNYSHIPPEVKMEILSFKEGDMYAKRGIQVLQEEGSNGRDGQSALFEEIGKHLHRRVEVPKSLQEAREIQRLLDNQRARAESLQQYLKINELEELGEKLELFIGKMKER